MATGNSDSNAANDRQRLLAALLRERGFQAPLTPHQVIQRHSQTSVAPLTYAQQRLWFMQQLAPDSPFYNLAYVFRLSGELNFSALESALNSILLRHTVLRTRFQVIDERLVQEILPMQPFKLQVTDVREIPLVQREIEVNRLQHEEACRIFDLETGGLLLRAHLLRLENNLHHLQITIHHIAFERWSLSVVMKELTAFYDAFGESQNSHLPELPIQYSDFAIWQQTQAQKAALQTQLDYWKSRLTGVPLLALPTDFPRPSNQTFRGAHQPFNLPTPLTEKLRTLSKQEKSTLFMVTLAAFQVLLHRYTGQDDLAVGIPVAGRTYPEVEPLIGLFINTLVLRVQITSDLTFRDLLAQVRQVSLDAHEHQDLPIETLIRELHLERDLSYTPLFQVLFAFQNTPPIPSSLGNLAMQFRELDTGTSKFDLTLFLIEDGADLSGVIEYSTDLFTPETISRLIQHFLTLLDAITQHPDDQISRLPMITEQERQQLLVEWNATQVEIPQLCVHQLFEAQVALNPESAAVQFAEQTLTYADLNARANRLAHTLRDMGILPGHLVGVCVERSLNMLVAVLGVQKAGAAYIPLDPAFPPGRVAFMIADSHMVAIVTQEALLPFLSTNDCQMICLDRDAAKISASSAENPISVVHPEDLIYAIYTSGSTGQPKGVAITHRSVVNFLAGMQTSLEVTPNDCLVAVTTLSFDIAALEIYLPLSVGARLVIASREVASDGFQLASLLEETGATMMQATPATWRLLVEANWDGTPHIKILCGGEALPRELATQLLTRGAVVWNLYGPTETTIWSTTWRMTDVGGPILIGRPIFNTQLYILDRHLQPVPIGVAGELCIGGMGLAKGYLDRPQLTDEKFIPNPFVPGERIYRTGDQARYRANGDVEFFGRIDSQIKLRGFRIELGEIEAVLERYSGVNQATVLVREDTPGDRRLVAYIVGNLIADRINLYDQVQAHYENGTTSVEINALSQDGASLGRLPLDWQVGQHLQLDLMLPGSSTTLLLKGKLIWTDGGKGGVQFELTTEQQEILRQKLQRLLQEQGVYVVEMRHSMLRIQLRRDCQIKTETGQVWNASADNYSLDGLGLSQLPENCLPGDRLQVQIVLPGIHQPMNLNAQVIWVAGNRAGLRLESDVRERDFLQKSLEYIIEGEGLTVSHLRSYLQEHLPPYMIPAAFVNLDSLPLTPNGKVDRRALPVPILERSDLATAIDYVPPRDELENKIANIWQSVLNLPRVGVLDNFFDLGGNSLLTAVVHQRIKQTIHANLSITEMFYYPTIRALADRISGAEQQLVTLDGNQERAVTRRASAERQRQRRQQAHGGESTG